MQNIYKKSTSSFFSERYVHNCVWSLKYHAYSILEMILHRERKKISAIIAHNISHNPTKTFLTLCIIVDAYRQQSTFFRSSIWSKSEDGASRNEFLSFHVQNAKSARLNIYKCLIIMTCTHILSYLTETHVSSEHIIG